MRVLVGKTFGLGNMVMCVPMLKALKSLESVSRLDLLIGSTPDDGGAYDVAKYLKNSGVIDNIYFDKVPLSNKYDVAIMSIPFDGRWRNGHHFVADKVMDGRTRPDPKTCGLVSWKKHEVEYQMDNAYELGYEGPVPDMSFYPMETFCNGDVYLGVGYKKDTNGFWSQKHWGNENFIKLSKAILEEFEGNCVLSTGDILDWKTSIEPIKRAVGHHLFIGDITTLDDAFNIMASCSLYVGNDTGMMHVAASMGIPCISVFCIKNSYVKNRPWGVRSNVFDGVLIEDTYSAVLEKTIEILNEIE